MVRVLQECEEHLETRMGRLLRGATGIHEHEVQRNSIAMWLFISANRKRHCS
jgi:hypothetical protein